MRGRAAGTEEIRAGDEGDIERVGFLDRLFQRAAKAGTPSETARVVGQQYLMLKEQNPEATDRDVFSAVVAVRHAAQPYTPAQFARLEHAVDTDSVTDFIIELFLVESNLRASEIRGAPLQSLVRVVMDELQSLGIH